MATATSFSDDERAALRSAMARGVLRVRMPDGAEIQYATLTEMQAVLDRADQAANAAAGVPAMTFCDWRRD